MSASEVFFTNMWNQLLECQADSFLAGYLRKDFSNATLDDLLGILADRNRKLQIEDKLETEYQKWLDGLRERAPGALPPKGEGGRKGGRVQYLRLREALKNHPEAVSDKDLEGLRKIVQDAAAVQDAWNFLYNSGFGRKKVLVPDPRDEIESEKGEEMEEAIILDRILPGDGRKREVRKKDRMLRMLDEWCEKTGHSLALEGASGAGGQSDGDRAAWKEMFRLLQGAEGKKAVENVESLILPVQIDPNTGIGLYLVGLGNFQNKELVEQLRAGKRGNALNCVFLCFGPTAFKDDTGEFPKNKVNLKLAYGASIILNPLMGEELYCVSFECGENLFSFLKNQESLAYDFFREHNGPPPPGTPKKLRRYFEQEDFSLREMDLQALAAEGRKESEKDRAIWKEKRKAPYTARKAL